MPGDQPASGGGTSSRRSWWRDGAGCLAYLLSIWVLFELQDSSQHWPRLGQAALYLALVGLPLLAKVYQIRRRGQTVAGAIAASRAERRRQAAARARAHGAAEALPWLRDRRLRPDTAYGVLIAPEPRLPGYDHAGYDIVLDSPGDKKISVIKQVMRLTGLDPKMGKELIERAPVTVLRVPDLAMAQAARDVLESAGATVSITDPAG